MPGTEGKGSWANPMVRAGILGSVYLLGAEIGHAVSLSHSGQTFATFWPPAGILLAVLTWTPYRHWPWMLAAASVANLVSDVGFHSQTVLVSLGFCTANLAEACLGGWLLRRFLKSPVTLGRIDEVLAVGFWAAVIAPLLGATIGAGWVSLVHGVPYGDAWKVWWVADAVAIMLTTPLAFTWALSLRMVGKFRPGKVVEAAAGFAGMAFMTIGIYGEFLPAPFTLPIFILPFLLWAGVRLGPRGATTALMLVALIGLWFTCRGQGPYVALPGDRGDLLLRAQTALFVLCFTVLILAALVAERKNAENQRVRLIGKLEQALAEIRVLRGLIPICAWCKKVRNDQGLWQSIEEYLHVHTDVKLTHGICADCMEGQVQAVKSMDAAEE